MKVQTDLEILEAIYDRHYDQFASYADDPSTRETKIYVPIDVDSIGESFGVDGDIIFGRLYYDLEKKYGYHTDDGTRVVFFSKVIGADRHCINFPLLSSVLAELKMEHKKWQIATAIASIALAVSIVSILISLLD